MDKPHGQFLSSLIVRDAGNGRHFFLTQPFSYRMRHGTVLTVPMGFVTDFASIPMPFRMVLPRSGRYNFAAVLHDYAGRTDAIPFFETNGDADQVMKDGMEDSPFPPNWLVRWVVTAGLRIGSRHFFHQHEVAWWPKDLEDWSDVA